ncbi:AAA family ATPase [Falsirhodobacter algicola]|uniref:AAA family ATPase n=1 Tax=Falsirhodobacter algicola TaxID=2692330 RepID=A0A8J8MW45_9RHOB|nr:AAA family ATPase [Falsirhodobacter algicola]QUS37429.1 AAA family ATPase [Falsirhodobacter algicola]
MLLATAELAFASVDPDLDVRKPAAHLPGIHEGVEVLCDEARARFCQGPVGAGFGVLRQDRRPDPAKLYFALTLAEMIGTEANARRMLQPGAISIIGSELDQHSFELELTRILWAVASATPLPPGVSKPFSFVCNPEKLQVSDLVSDDLPIVVLANPRSAPPMITQLDPLIISDVLPSRERVAWMIAWCYPRVGSHPPAMSIVQRYLPDDDHLRRLTPAQIIAAMRARTASRAIRTLNRVCRPRATASDTPPLTAIAGLGEAKDLALQIVQDLRDWARSSLSATEICRGILLYGAPGTGKTTLARALAAEAGIGFFSASYAIWQRSGEGHIGAFLKAMHATFEAAANAAPSILFIDEIDAFGSRSTRDDHGASYYKRIISGLLEELDGIAGRDGVVVIAACNHLERIDPAIIRAGRFDRRIQIMPPSPAELAVILRQHLGSDLPDADLMALAALAVGKTGADCAAALRTARTSARAARRNLEESDLRSALLGDQTRFPDNLRWRIAVHELGHFIAAMALDLGEPVGIRLASRQGIFVMDPRPVEPCAPALHALRVKDLAGREAEKLILGDVSAGAGGGTESDLAKVMQSLMHEEFALGLGATGPLWLTAEPDPTAFFDLPATIQTRIRERIAAAERDAQVILHANVDLLDEMAALLAEHQVMDARQLAEYAKQVVVPTLSSDGEADRTAAPLIVAGK